MATVEIKRGAHEFTIFPGGPTFSVQNSVCYGNKGASSPVSEVDVTSTLESR
jgi:hypothetical protein